MTDDDDRRRAQQDARREIGRRLAAEARAARAARIATPEGVMRRDAAGFRICDQEMS